MSDSPKTMLLDWYLRYLKLGWPVFPLAPRSKVPLISKEQGGRGCLDATLNESKVREWYAQCPNANIGLATGHRFFALDEDIKKGGEESLDYLQVQHGRFPDTIQQVTGGGGRQFLLLMPDFPVRGSVEKLAPGIDIRGVGNYIVAPPSVHPESGRRYFWDGATLIEKQEILPAPNWLLDWLLRDLEKPEQRAAQKVPNQILEGGRNQTLFKIACSLRRKGFSAEEILGTLRVTNHSRCRPPLPLDELQTIANSSERYAPATRSNLFATAPPESIPPAAEQPPNPADVEAAIDSAIERNDLVSAIRLVPDVAKMRPIVQAVIKAKLRQHFGRDFPAREYDHALQDAGGDGAGQKSPPGDPEGEGAPPGGPDLLGYPLTDAGNGERIVALFGSEIRYCVEMQRWLVWDGKRWAVDEMNTIREKAKQMARILYAQAIGQTNYEKHARASENYAGVTVALGSAATHKGIPISVADLDQQPMLLNCPNGVIDLRNGKLLPHKKEFLITKLCPVVFDLKAECPRFLHFLHWAMGANPDAELTERTVRLVSFLQRAFGYALTSDISEKAVFILHGERGNNGKTTLLTLFRDLLGRDYSGQLVIDTVMSMRNQDATTRADLADLRGVRLVVTSEVEREHKLNEGKIKYITAGMGNIKSCRKYENPIEFQATHKLFMDCNHRPTVRGVDDAIWRRLKLVPFEVTISDEEKDLQLLDKLRAELPGVLAWAVRGCVAWQQDGLGDPPEVSAAGHEWREHDDPLKEFLEDCCETGAERDEKGNHLRFVRAIELAAGYEWWAKQNRERYPLGREGFNERLLAKGFRQSRSRRLDTSGREDKHGKQARSWEGIELRSEVAAVIRRLNPSQPTLD